jgi:hypothetical protein
MSAPKRIWATVNGASTRLPDGGRQLIGGWSEDKDLPRAVEYIRADLSAIEAPAAASEVTEEMVERAAKKYHAHQHGQNLDDYGDGEYSRGIRHSMRLALAAALKGGK